MNRIRTAMICCTVVIGASLALARVHPFGDAGLYAARNEDAPVLSRGQVPEDVRAILEEKCADCHSDRTRAPLYGRFAPASWLMERDIVKGREAMNLARWDSYAAIQQQTLAAKMVQETRMHEMPLPQYRMIHWNARMGEADIRTLAGWARALSGSAVEPVEQGAGEGDPVRGKALFEKRCTGCHALTENHEGPRLQGVYGRRAGTAAGFAYSAALKKAGIVWDDESLEKWLADPDALVAGNDMDFMVSKPQERLDLISYFHSSANK